MISVGSRDGRKRLGSGLEMEDTELEEGEAFSYHDEGEDSTIDPDIDLSYIGEKLQNVLGHFQKDFEGGVSAENLGAKFGGYGSFLPTYQRSPSWSHTKSPAGGHNYGSPRSPRRQYVEDQRRNSIASSSAYPSVKSHAASRRAASVDNSVRDSHLQSKHAEESNSKGGAIKKPANSSDQRTLKVRIKVGSENLSTQKNAEIYSGLGLEVSPSSSLDCSPAISEGQRAKGLSAPEESPTSILQIMTSYPRELLLSPLREDLIHLTEKMKIRENKRTDNASTESSGMLGNGYLFSKSHHKLEQKRQKSNGKDDTFSVDLPIQKSNGDKDYKVPLLKKENESEIDTLGYEELVFNTLKLPLLSGTQHSTADPVKDVPTATNFSLNTSNDGVKRETCSTFMEEEHLDTKFEKLGGLLGSSGKVSESKKGKSSSTAAFPQPDTPLQEKSLDLEQSESNASKGRKGPRIAGTPEHSKEFPKVGSSSVEGLVRTSEKPSTGSKRKQKSGGSVQGAYMVKDESMVDSSLTHSGGRKSHSNNLIPKNDSYDPRKAHEKPGNRYKDFFGDIEFENEDNESISGEMATSGGFKNDFVAKKGLSKHNMKEKCNDDNLEKPVPPDTHHRFASHVDPLHENGAGSEPPTGTVPVVKEDWVSCDKCHKWRLLPLGTNPNSLPHKWICRMLNWLPGMNRCSIPEEETTNALMALYNPAAPIPARASEGQHTRLNDSVGTSVGMTSADARYPDFAQENDAAQTVSGKKKQGSSKALDTADLNGSTKSSNLRKKNLVAPGKKSNISNRSRSPSLDTHGYQHMPQSASVAEKYNDAKREKISLANSASQDTNLKKRSKTDPEVSRASKRVKSEELRFDDDNWTYDNVGTSSKAGRGSSSLSNNTSDNDRYKFNNHKDLSGKTNNAVSEKPVLGTSTDDLLCSGKFDKESVRKRKAKEPHGSQVHTGPFSSSGRCQPETGEFPEELLESDRRKEKKARVSKSGGKETSGSKTSLGSDRKTKGAKDQYNGQYLSNNQAPDYLKNDMGPVQPLVAANSSSSKVSGSHKNRTNGQEIKGSPVESVSSSPLRFHNADRVASSRKNLDAKDDFHDSGSLSAATPKRLSGGEDGGNDGSGMGKNHVTEMYNDNLCQSDQYGSVKRYSEQHGIEEKTNADQSHNSEFHAKKLGKWGYKDKVHASGSGSDKVNIKTLDYSHDSLNHTHLYEKSKSRRSRSDEKSGNPIKGEKFIVKKDAAGGTSGESSKGQNQKKFGYDGPDAMKSQDKKQVLDNEKLPRKNGQVDACQGEKSHPLPPTAKVQNEVAATLRPATESQKENSLKAVAVDAFDNGDTLKEPNQRKRSENPNGKPVRHPTPNSHKVRDVDAPSPLRRDSSSHAANNALKEAKDLKHLADRMKNSGSGESIGYYFQAALKFLHGASLLESGSSEAPKHNDLMHSMHIYSSTAKLCGFCAHEYEKLKDMAAAALAYKCMEVAYMRVVYSSHASASRDRNELQSALQIAPSGESPSSSASDVDNLNHQATDKAALAKVVSSPQVSGSHIITSRTRSGFLRILNFAQDVNFAMEASRKSRIAFTAATSRLGETSEGEGISSLKKALDFNFQDVDGLLRLVRFAMEAIAH